MNHFAEQIRRIILEQSKRAHVGHIGSALSIADILAALYFEILKISSPEDLNRDRFILSKGHAALALYASFFLKGWMDKKTLNSYCSDHSQLGVHPETVLRGVDLSTGSLGQGLSVGVGIALAARMKKSNFRTFVLISDAECNIGAVWEAAMFAAHHRLSNLYVIVDCNGQQAYGYTKDVLNLDPLHEKWNAFGWETAVTDGHDVSEITRTVSSFSQDKPRVLIAKTVLGKKVSFMEKKIEWHYSPMTEEQYLQALKDLPS